MRILGLCRSRSLAHAGRLHRLGRALQAAGASVELAGAEPWPEALGDALPWRWHAEPRSATEGDEAARFAAALADDLALLRARSPDLVIVDNRRSALVAARILDIPSLSITGAASLGPGCVTCPTASEWASLLAPTLGLDPALAMALAAQGSLDRPFPQGSAPLPAALRAVIEAAGGLAPPLIADLSLGDETVSADAPALFPLHPEAPVRSAGALLPEVRGQAPAAFRTSPHPRIILTGGSSPGGDTAALHRPAERWLPALAGCSVVTSLPLPPSAARPGLWWAPRLDLPALLPDADLLLCHGGAMTVQTALYAGVPVLALPDNPDAAVCAIALLQSGAGSAWAPGDLDADPRLAARALRWLLEDPRFRARAAALAPQMRPEAALTFARDQALSLLGAAPAAAPAAAPPGRRRPRARSLRAR